MKYTPYDIFIQLISTAGNIAFIGKLNIKFALRFLPMHSVYPVVFGLLGVKFDDMYGIDYCYIYAFNTKVILAMLPRSLKIDATI